MLNAILLGALQGVTEFLPISSSGHLVLLQHFLTVEGDDLAFDLMLHLGTLVPVLVLFRDDLITMISAPFQGGTPFFQRDGARWILFVLIASVPTALMGLLLEDLFESMFSGFGALSWQFAVTAGTLQATSRYGDGQRGIQDMTWKDALIIGIAQGVAILPAISRSGSTIAAGLFLGLKRDLAGRFSFVLSIPAIGGAAILKADDVAVDAASAPAWALGTAVALVVGWVSLVFLMRVIRGGDFSKFSWYCWGMAAACGVLAITA